MQLEILQWKENTKDLKEKYDKLAENSQDLLQKLKNEHAEQLDHLQKVHTYAKAPKN